MTCKDCRIARLQWSDEIELCLLHGAAVALLAACKKVLGAILKAGDDGLQTTELNAVVPELTAAIAKAEEAPSDPTQHSFMVPMPSGKEIREAIIELHKERGHDQK